jgi:hypothetical protein
MAAGVSAGDSAARRLLGEKDTLSLEIADALYAERPELMDRYGAAGRERCREDLRFNLEHLAPAVALDEPALFAGYVTWLAGLLSARRIPGEEIARSLALTGEAIARRFPPDEAAAAQGVLAAGLRVLAGQGTADGR